MMSFCTVYAEDRKKGENNNTDCDTAAIQSANEFLVYDKIWKQKGKEKEKASLFAILKKGFRKNLRKIYLACPTDFDRAK